MRYINHIQRSAVMLILLIAGWVGCPVFAQTVVEAVPNPSTNLVGTNTGSAIQPLESWNISEYGISLNFSVGSGRTNPAYYINGSNIRLYSGNTFSIESSSSYEIESVLFWTSAYKSDESTLSSDCGEIVYDAETLNFSWNNVENVTKVTFNISNSQLRFTGITLTLRANGEVAQRPKAPVLSQTSCNFYKSFELTITDVNDDPTTIKYTLDGSEPSADNGQTYTAPVVIPEGNSVTIKAVCINENGVSAVTQATYSFIAKHLLSVVMPNKSGISYVYYSSNTEYGEWYDDNSTYITDGENVYIGFSLNSGYKCRSVLINGVPQSVSSNYFEFVMPSNDVEIVIDAEFDPSSPSDPQPGEQTKKYNLSLVCNPIGAASLSGAGTYTEGSSVYVYASNNSGYVFTGWTKDGETVNANSSISFTMPASDVVLTANFAYSPSNPTDPQQPTLKHPLTVIASPAGSGTFSISSSEVTYGQEYYVYAYPQSGYKFKGWIVNGVAQEEASTTFRGIMTDAGAQVVGLFVFDPSMPDEPNLNHYDGITGRMIIDHFSIGGLSSAIQKLINGYNYDGVTSLIVKGKINNSDISYIKNLSMLQSLDLSRTAGVQALPNNVFSNMVLTSLILPSDIESLGRYVFDGCSNLILLSLHAQVPPTTSTYTFSGFTPENCTLRVPEESIELYKADEYWSKFAEIIPLGDAIHVLEVQLPSVYRDGKLKNNRIEVVNTATGRRQRYVITDRNIYTFNGAQKDDQYLVLLTSETGMVMSRIENVIMPDADYAVAFTDIKTMVPVSATITLPNGEDCTNACTIEWYQSMLDGTDNYVSNSAVLGKVPENEVLIAKVSLPRDLAMKYLPPRPMKVEAQAGMDAVNITLEPLKVTILSGRILDEEGLPAKSACVKIYQRIAGKYDKSNVVRIDADGRWTSTVVDAPITVLTYSASECLNRIDSITPDMFQSFIELGDITMASSVGARIRVSLSYVEATVDGQDTGTINDYTDIENVSFSVFNKTQNRNHNISVQYPTILVLDQVVNSDDELVVKATASNDDFHDAEIIVKVGTDARPNVQFTLIGKGGIRAVYSRTDNPNTVALLVNSTGNVIKQAQFENNAVSFSGLEAGKYSVIAMTRSSVLNAVASVSAMDELGLVANKDYALTTANVENGLITVVNFDEVPSVDESLFTFTGSNTSITPNKNSVSTGQYITIRSLIDFKPVYRNRVSDVRIEYVLPEGCNFVDGSVMKGSNKFGYDRGDDNRIVVDFNSDYSDQLRFCLIPTHSGQLSVVARAIFELDGQTVIQPIGSANLRVKDLDFVVPSRTCYNEIVATGVAPANSKVQIVQDGTTIGEGISAQNGNWNIECSLIDTYNQKDCQLQAVVTTPENVELVSNVRTVVFDGAAIMIDRVTMLTGSEEVVFDFNHKNNTQSYTWVDGKLFTFIVKLTENAPSNLEGVRLFVKTLDGGERAFDCYYSESRDAWLCVGNFTSETAPINVSVSLFRSNGLVFDRAHFTSFLTDEQRMADDAQETKESIEALILEKEITEVQTEEDVSNIDAFLAGYDTFTAEERLTAVNELLVKVESNTIEFDYPDDLLGDKDEISQIIEKGRTLLLPLDDYDYSGVDSLMARFDKFQADCGISDDTELITSADIITGEYDGHKYTYRSVTADQINLSKYDENQIRILNTDDGSQVKIITTETEVIVLDETINHAWIILSVSSESMRLAKAKSEINWQEFIRLGEQIKSFYDFIKSNIDAVCAKAEHMLEMAEVDIKNAENEIKRISERINNCGDKLRDTEIELNKIEKQLRSGYVSADKRKELEDLYELYEEQEKSLSKQMKEAKGKLGKAKTSKAALKAKGLAFKGVVDKATVVLDVVWRIGKAIYWSQEARTVHNQWLDFIDTILPCEADNDKAMWLSGEASMADLEVANGYLVAMRCAAGSGVAGIISTGVGYLSNFVGNPIAGIAIKGLSIIGDVASGMLYDKAKSICEDTRSKSKSYFAKYVKERRKLKCRKDKEDDPFDDPNYTIPKGGNNGDNNGNNGDNNDKIPAGNDAEKRVAIDPAGYVYEGVHSNRVEGVQATAYYREQVESMYGDISLEVKKWNAEEFAQKNPLFTDANGMYAWDVPAGEWQVKFEKDGYNTSYSEWLPVPPPQLEVNVEIIQNSQPEIIEVHAYAEGVDITFDKYMDIKSLNTSSIFVTANGTKLEGSVEMLDEERSSDSESGKLFASKIRFVPEFPLSVNTGTLRLTVNRNVLSYAGIPMTETYTQELDIEKEILAIVADEDLLKVLYGGDKNVTVSVLPSDAGSGRTLRIANTSPLVVTADVEEIELDENGQGKFTLTGDMPGSSSLIFSIDGTDKTGSVDINVLTEIITAEAPKSSRASGTAVYRGTKVELTTESKDGVIYFTTDGSCPCDENGTRRKYTVPIIINEDTKILAMTSVGNGDDDVSETVEFNYTLKRSDMDFQMPEGWTWMSHNFESAIAPADLSTDEGISRILSQTQEVIRDPHLGMVGTLQELSASESYKVETTTATTRQRLSDIAWNPATPIALQAGWNWLGYPVSQTMSVDEAFATTNAETLDVVVGQNGFAQFDGENWIGSLETMSPGMGYMYQSQSAKSVVYNTSIVSTASAKYAAGISKNSPLVLDIHKYGAIMPVVATINNADGSSLDNEDYQVAAFCGSECRGIGRVVKGLVMMNVYGNVNDPIIFHVTDVDGETRFDNNVSLKFSETVVGDIFNPYVITINNQSGIADVKYDGNIKVSVDGDMLRIKGIAADKINLVEVYDINGQKLIHETGVSESGIRISTLTNGVYVVIVSGSGEYTYHKIAVR